MRMLDLRRCLWLSLAASAAFAFAACGDHFSAVSGEGGAGEVAGQPTDSSNAGESLGGGGAQGGSTAPSAGEGNVPTNAGAGADQGGAPTTAATYRQLVLDDEPLVYWRMGAAKNRVVADETGGGNDLVLQGTGHELDLEGAIEGDPDGAIGFDGATSFAIASNARALDFVNSAKFSLECWARRGAGGESYFQHLLSNVEGVAGNRDGFALYLLPEPAEGDSARSVFEYDKPMADLGIWGPVVDTSSWGHYVAVFDGKQASLYVNGTLASSEMSPGGIVARTVPFTVGRAAGVDGSYFKGALDELAVYPRTLTIAEITEHFGFARAP